MAASAMTPFECSNKMDYVIKNDKGKFITIDIPKVIDNVIESYFPKSVDSGEIYIYTDNVYSPGGSKKIGNILDNKFYDIRDECGNILFPKRVKLEILDKIQSRLLIDINEFDSNRNILNLKNGLMNLDKLDKYELLPHTNKTITTSQINATFDSEAECPYFQEYMDLQVDKKYHNCIYELIGSILYPEYHTEKAFMFHGPKRTGKGTMIRVIEELIGESNISHVSLQDLSGNRFARASLFGKMLNTYGDLPITTVADPGIFKNVTGEDTIEAENKGRPRFRFRNKAKLLYSCNDIPELKVYDDAYCGRWIIIPFNKTFYGKENPSMEAKLKTPSELSGILNLALEGLKRLQSNEWHFSYDVNYGLNQFKRKSNPVLAFLEDKCQPSDNGTIPKNHLLLEYNKWAKENNLPPASSKKAFGSKIQDQSIIPVDTSYPKQGAGGKQVESWSGISYRT